MSTFAEEVVLFCKELNYKGLLPSGISIMNPFRDNPKIISLISQFYTKFYNDHHIRHLILGINPGRFGAGVTGISFTDSERLSEKCGLSINGLATYEISSVFIYEMIDAYGGAENFYSKFFISSISPLGFTSVSPSGQSVNYNYYDSKELTETVYSFIIESLNKQLGFGIERDVCFCLGTGKNYKFLLKLNSELKLFGKIVAIEHPRYIMQYKSKQKQKYIDKYLDLLQRV